MRNRVKSFYAICPFMSSRKPGVNEGEYKALIHCLKWTHIFFIQLLFAWFECIYFCTILNILRFLIIPNLEYAVFYLFFFLPLK